MEQPGGLNDVNLYEVLEALALQQSSAQARPAGHNSRLVRVAPGSWQARLFGQMPDLRHVADIADFERAMAEHEGGVVFIADRVTIDAASIARICTRSGHDKTVIWEDGGLA